MGIYLGTEYKVEFAFNWRFYVRFCRVDFVSGFGMWGCRKVEEVEVA